MMRETLRFLASPVRGLQAAVYVLAASALLSSLLALVRDRLFAHTFGAGMELDLYYAAFRIPDFLFVATGALVSVYILIPQLARRTPEGQKRYIDAVVLAFSALAILASAIAAYAAPHLLRVLFPQFASEDVLPTLTALTRILLLQPILLGLSNVLAAVTQSKHRYALYSLSPVLYNLGIISGLMLYFHFGIEALAWGVVFGAALHLGIQIPSVIHDGFFRSMPGRGDAWALLETVAISIPRALALSMNQITFLGLTAIATSLAVGSLSVFMLSFNLMSVPLAVIGASYSVAAFPTLASALSEGRAHDFLEHVSAAARYVLFWSLPAIALIIVLRAHLVRVVLGSGEFDWTDTRLTAAVFALLSISLAGQGLTLLLTRAYYAAGRTFVPFFVAGGVAASTIALASALNGLFADAGVLHFVQNLMRLGGVEGSSVLSLALAYSTVSIAGVVVLILHFEHRFGGFVARIGTTFWQSTCAALAAGFAAYAALVFVGPLTLSSTVLSVFLKGLLGGVAGILGAACMYLVFANREYLEIVSSVRGKLWRAPLPATQPIASAEEISSSSPQ